MQYKKILQDIKWLINTYDFLQFLFLTYQVIVIESTQRRSSKILKMRGNSSAQPDIFIS